MTGHGVILFVFFFVLWVVFAGVVAVHASENDRNPVLWGLLVFFLGVWGLIVYVLVWLFDSKEHDRSNGR